MKGARYFQGWDGRHYAAPSYDEGSRASPNMLTMGAIAPVVKQNAPVVKDICPGIAQGWRFARKVRVAIELLGPFFP